MTNLQVEATVIDTDSNSIMMTAVLQEGETTIIPPPNPSLNTSVNQMSPYVQTSSPLTVSATGDSRLDNVTLYYRWSDDNSSWNGGSNEIYDGVDSNTSNVDGIADKGVETNFSNAKNTTRDGKLMILQEQNTGTAAVNEWLSCNALGITYPGWTRVVPPPMWVQLIIPQIMFILQQTMHK